jgi:aldose 1-epimerase
MELQLSNLRGSRVTLSDRGAAICRIDTPDRKGCFSNIALCPRPRDEHPAAYAYAGATLGPSAGRIPDGWLTLNGRRIALAPNERTNHLHGGPHGLSAQRWKCEGSTPSRALFRCDLPAGLDGYPGNRHFTTEYLLDEADCLTLRLRAETDEPTWINLSNHTYWNLSGDFSATVADHWLQIPAENALWNDEQHIPQSCRAVEGTPLDLRNGALLGERLTLPDPQLTNARGFNNFYQLSQGRPALTLRHPPSGRVLFLTTDLPWLVFYSGGYLDESLLLEGGQKGHQACALALEPQLSPVYRIAREVSQITTPQQPYDHWIAFRWGVEG